MEPPSFPLDNLWSIKEFFWIEKPRLPIILLCALKRKHPFQSLPTCSEHFFHGRFLFFKVEEHREIWPVLKGRRGFRA